ncbi:N-formylglutamate amidohydrolase [Ruegeria faecimaris]|uniref:Predicted N-formylglutamate amidohydrolase n=1 Tax=Ruegeria faecimaris TaxID=686389 RepID=A0A521BUG5_9RHOB|nr:N-formylglutamate amidohydrolase [Ruegeria faecimaris]SMO50809.1 Predicted N-formylglutamate amidohydrolase [Ruegeria faecimaris]
MNLCTHTLLGPNDPAPIDVVNADSTSEIVLLCEHAGNAVPEMLGDLGVSRDVIESHRGWDIGAQDVARQLAEQLNAPLVVQNYSRLVFDCNRPPDSPLAVPAISDQVEVPGNSAITELSRAMRVDEIFRPMDAELNRLFANRPRRAAFSIHSFTPHLDGKDRPWQAGFLSRGTGGAAKALMAHIAQRRPDMAFALNKPYQIETEGDWFIPAHAEPRELVHCLIEIRNDQIREQSQVGLWADLLADAILTAVGDIPS